ncbi:acyltransferase family protein [Rugamonas sp. FT107W]|uniref:Acyltransferase family protein n=1 Tax=Duganella vulcania TaxID=2692166 RepID=A0A845HFW3_9BURK|nr:acyltransferase [Duganella vulcania]MYN17690.1 acyltransferase family protein [Duganella vulcania]
MESFSKVLGKHRGIGPGFDFLRVFLAVSIVAVHSVLLTGHRDLFEQSIAWFLEYALVPMFFALSGFLITGSAIRLSLKNFLINRGLRIVPALAVDVFICALVIGPLLTTGPLRDYFADSRFHAYFLNVIGRIHYLLPAVFDDNPTHYVNGALWTVPYEILCYVIAAFFIIFNWLTNRTKVVLFTFSLLLIGALIDSTGMAVHFPVLVKKALDRLLLSREAQIVEAFLLGVVMYQWRDFIPYSKGVFIGCVVVCFGAALLPAVAQANAARLILLPVLTYITVFVGLTEVPIPAYFKKGDYSYGIYLYHDPLMQVVISLFPAIALRSLWGTLFTFSCGLTMVLVMSNLSWHFIEKPILAMRKKFSFVARVRDLA